MVGLKSLLEERKASVKTGTIVQRTFGSVYSVQIGPWMRTARNMTGGDLSVGARVAVILAETGWHIVGSAETGSRTFVEVAIDG